MRPTITFASNPNDDGRPDGDSPAMCKALHEISTAMASKRVESICMAYQALRNAGAGIPLREFYEFVKSRLGPEVIGAVISAYSHRRCFMCEAGTVPCDQCDGASSAATGRCPYCAGLGVTICGFCRGNGWADESTVPPELRRAVRDKQVKHVREESLRIHQKVLSLNGDDLSQMPDATRRQLGAWLMRFRARLRTVADRNQVAPADRPEHDSAAAESDRLLDRLAGQKTAV